MAKSKTKNSQKIITREEYVNLYKDIAIAHQRRFGIPASITMAQGIIESGCGNSELSRKSNNHFGIKCKSDWRGKSVRYDDDEKNECFRAYRNVEASYEDHALFLEKSPRYASLFQLSPTDYKGWARGLKAAGYATAPDYAEKLINAIENYGLFLLDGKGGSKSYEKYTAQGTPKSTSEKVASTASVKQAINVGGGVNPNNYQVAVNSINGNSIYSTNKTLYILARSGDDYRSLSKSLNTSARKLRYMNDETNRKATLRKGEVVYIEMKQRKWRGEERTHTVKSNETIRYIAQSYGIREASLRSRNKIKEGEPEVGEVLRIR
ncbi:MAG: glucosaminidase domain-containing protein [Rikenellaceae bacterium]